MRYGNAGARPMQRGPRAVADAEERISRPYTKRFRVFSLHDMLW